VTTPSPDDGLPARLRALAFIREGEAAVGRSWFRSLTRWLDRVRPGVLAGGRLDPGRVSDHNGYWTGQVNTEVVPSVSQVLSDAWARVRGQEPARDPWVAHYLNDVGNRLVRLPDEVYALIVAEIEAGIRDGRGIPEVTAEVNRILTSTGSERWPNRARTVARTETIGAVNAGVFRAAQLDAQDRGDPAPFKVWLATDDTRTRHTHSKADGQRTLLDSPFQVGTAQLMFPGDPRGPAGEVINCRCSLLPVILGDVLDWTDRQRPRGTA
jgi:hypothetical protein